MKMNRRSFVMAGCSSLFLSSVGRAESAPLLSFETRTLSFYNLHTGESLKSAYFEGAYVSESLAEIDRIFRDHRNGEVHPIAPRLLDTLFALSSKLGTRKPFEIISGFRSPSTNALLRREGHNVAEHSLHMDGIAVDIRLADRGLSTLRDAALSLKAGGVGYYPRDRFVHVDVGRVRSW